MIFSKNTDHKLVFRIRGLLRPPAAGAANRFMHRTILLSV